MNTTAVGPFEFLAAGRLWALIAIPLLILLYLWALRSRRNRGIRYTNTGVLGAVLPAQRQWRRHVAVAMALSSLALITGAWARPVAQVNVPRERATVIVVLDTSQSMAATDVAPNRLDAAREAAKKFVATLPAKYNVAIVSLSGNPAVLAPPTTDRGLVNRAIDVMRLEDGTAIGGAINAGLAALKQAPASTDGDEPAPGLMVLLSDGTNNAGQDPVAAARTALAANVPVYTIAYGTENGYVDIDGRRENVAPDRATLSDIATITNARALDAVNADELENVYKRVGSEMGTEMVLKEVTADWVMYALACAVVAALGAVSMAARWP